MKNITKHLLSLAIVLTIVAAPAFPLVANALSNADVGIDAVAESGINLGDSQDPYKFAASIINVAISFLGLIAVIIILLGGFKWMTAGGSDEKINEAKKLMAAGIVGIIIVLAAWGIAKWFLEKAIDVTT